MHASFGVKFALKMKDSMIRLTDRTPPTFGEIHVKRDFKGRRLEISKAERFPSAMTGTPHMIEL